MDMYNKILVPFDGSDHAKNALRSAVSLVGGKESQSHVTVLYVQHFVQLYSGMATAWVSSNIDLNEVLHEEAERLLKLAGDILNQSAVPYDTRLVDGDPAQEICKLAQSGDYDLIVMGSRGLGAMTELALGSVSHKVIHRTHKPVLIIK